MAEFEKCTDKGCPFHGSPHAHVVGYKRLSETADEIIDLLLAIPFGNRPYVLDMIRNNGIVCLHCGLGSKERPNLNCHCENED